MISPASLSYPDPAGYGPLREAIAGYLATSRGIACKTSQIFITAGYQGALGLISRVLLKGGDQVWFEDPGYLRARRALDAAGARLEPIPVDADGMNVAQGMNRAPHARFAVVTPSHQSPLCVSLSLPRRVALLSWAASVGAYVIEDDYDSEFRYSGRPLPALKSWTEMTVFSTWAASARYCFLGYDWDISWFPKARYLHSRPHADFLERDNRCLNKVSWRSSLRKVTLPGICDE